MLKSPIYIISNKINYNGTKSPFWELTIHIIMRTGKALINHRLVNTAAIPLVRDVYVIVLI